MKKLSLIMCLVLLSIMIFTGCTEDSTEIDDQVYTLVIGADKGVNNKVRVTVQFPVYKSGGDGASAAPKKSSGSDGEGGKEDTGEVNGTIVQTVEAPTLLEAINLLNTSTSRSISLVQIKQVVFSEKLAKEGIGRYLEPLARFRETRRMMQVVICRGNAEDFIKENKTLVGESLSKAMELMLTESNDTGFFPNATFHNFYLGMVNPYSMPYAVYAGLNDFTKLPELGEEQEESSLKTKYDVPPGEIPRKGDLKREFFGTAVFDGDKMVGNLTSYETRYFLMITGDFKRGFFTIPDKENPDLGILLDARLGRKPQIKAYFKNGKPVIDVNITIECDLGSIQGRENYEKLDKVNDLNRYIEKIIQKDISKTIEKTQKEWGTDIFGFGGYIARNFGTVTEFEKYNWKEHYRETKVNVDVSVNVRRTGGIMSASPVRGTKGIIEGNKEH